MNKNSNRQPKSGRSEVIAGIAAGLVIAVTSVVSVQMISAKPTPPAVSVAASPR
ncbi:MAG: hypothetical protein JWN94_727, partial [Betaproteobacteria bacterium]|nr:hypothetical protein [Betaproteobacteria bacterium]